jgi:hypothetical protein
VFVGTCDTRSRYRDLEEILLERNLSVDHVVPLRMGERSQSEECLVKLQWFKKSPMGF